MSAWTAREAGRDDVREEAMRAAIRPLVGRKGGKSGGGGGSSTEAADNLFSDSTASVIDLVSEGPIEGWADAVNPEKCIYFDDVPLMNDDGSLNYEGVKFWLRTGEESQEPVPGFPAVEAEVNVGLKVTASTPVVRTIADTEPDAIRVTIQTPQMSAVVNGDLVGTEVEYAIETQVGSAAWEAAVASDVISGKTTTGYQRAWRVDLPEARPVSVRVRRITAESEEASLSNDIYWNSYTTLIDANLSYPNSAYVALSIPADAFGGRLPTRSYRLRGVKLLAPSNYNPDTGEYDETVPWDGTFQTVYHTNPAWALYTLLLEDRWGLGEKIDAAQVDKCTFYAIGKYCDELVSDGKGGLERRYTINGPLKDREAAYDVIRRLSALFRGLTYWGAGAVVPTADMPSDPVMLVTNANVVGGRFNYPSTALSARKNAAIAAFRVPERNYALLPMASADDPNAIATHGVNEAEIDLPFTTSWGEAQRACGWLVDTDVNQTGTVEYVAGLDHAAIRPGDVVLVSDKNRIGWRASGRVKSIDVSQIELDAPVTLEAGETYQLLVTPRTGGAPATFTLDGAHSGSVSTLHLSGSPDLSNLKAGAVFALSATSIAPRRYRILANRPDGIKFAIIGVRDDPDKYLRVEAGVKIETDAPYITAQTGAPDAPSAIGGTEVLYRDGTAVKSAIDISVTLPSDTRATVCEIAYRTPSATVWTSLGRTARLTARIPNTEVGEYGIRARSLDQLGRPSAWLEDVFDAQSLLEPPATPTKFRASVRDGQITFRWDDGGELDLWHAELRHSGSSSATWAAAQKVADIPKPATSIVVPALAGRYFLKTVDAQGVKSVDAAQIVIDPGHFGPINVVETLGAGGADGWVGAMSKCALINGALEITPGGLLEDWPPLSDGGYLRTLGASTPVVAYYYFSDVLDLGEIYTSRLSASLDVSGYDYRWRLHRLPPLSERWLLSPPEPEEWSARLELRTSDDGAIWSDWAPLEAADYLARAYEFRLRLETAHEDVTPRVARAEIVIDMPDRIAQGDDVAAPAGGASIAYAPAFRAKPALVVTPQDLAAGDYFELRQQTAAGFEIEFFNASGVSVARSFDWIARGYGAVI